MRSSCRATWTSTKACDDAAKAAQDKFGGRHRYPCQRRRAARARSAKTGAETTADEFEEIITLNMNGCFKHDARRAGPP